MHGYEYGTPSPVLSHLPFLDGKVLKRCSFLGRVIIGNKFPHFVNHLFKKGFFTPTQRPVSSLSEKQFRTVQIEPQICAQAQGVSSEDMRRLWKWSVAQGLWNRVFAQTKIGSGLGL